jgi:hypothetical protein
VIAIVSCIFACCYISRIHAGQVRSASDVKDLAKGSFLFLDPASNRPITVWFCRPSSITPDTRIVLVMHGSESETARQACEIASPYLQSLNAIVLAPQFSEQYFPGDTYMFGNMIDTAGEVLPKSMWALPSSSGCSISFETPSASGDETTTSSGSRVVRNSFIGWWCSFLRRVFAGR